MIVSLIFLLVVIGLMATPWHFHLLWGETDERGPAGYWWRGVTSLVGLIVGVLTVIIPLRIGARALRRMEF